MSETAQRKRVLITGITGMDGYHLSSFLISQRGDMIYGLVRRNSACNLNTIADRRDCFNLIYGDITDQSSLEHALEESQPDEIYHLAGQSHVRVSFDVPESTLEITGMGTLKLLEAVRRVCKNSPKIYLAQSSEMFGDRTTEGVLGFQNESTPLLPASPYGSAKVLSYNIGRIYRQSYGMFICNGILFNHESPYRGANFVTQKIAKGVADIVTGRASRIVLGNLDALRDWGYAGDYVQAMYKMLQHDVPDDYVVATGATYSVRHFAHFAFKCVGLNYTDYVDYDAKYTRPYEVPYLRGDYSKIRTVLGWEPAVSFGQLVEMMVLHQLKKVGAESSFIGLSTKQESEV